MYKLLESQTTSSTFSFGYIAQKGNFLELVLLSVKPSRTWIVDSGATNHMTGESSTFSSYSPCASNLKIKIVDGSLTAVVGKGYVVISPLLTLQDVLHVPNLSCNILSVSKLIWDKKCQTHFFYTIVCFKIQSRRRQLSVLSTMEDSTALKMNLKLNINLDKYVLSLNPFLF